MRPFLFKKRKGKKIMESCIPVYRVMLVKDREENYGTVGTSDQAAAVLRKYLAGADREYFVALFLDIKNNVTGINTVSVGTLSASIVHPREVFKAAILANAAKIIIAHNHPSGDITPSGDDIDTSRRIAEAGEIIGIPVVDSLILGDKDCFSLCSAGLLQAGRQ
jgi:DNA repair protein RadC